MLVLSLNKKSPLFFGQQGDQKVSTRWLCFKMVDRWGEWSIWMIQSWGGWIIGFYVWKSLGNFSFYMNVGNNNNGKLHEHMMWNKSMLELQPLGREMLMHLWEKQQTASKRRSTCVANVTNSFLFHLFLLMISSFILIDHLATGGGGSRQPAKTRNGCHARNEERLVSAHMTILSL